MVENEPQPRGGAPSAPLFPDDGGAPSLELVRRIQDGEDGAWDALYQRYRDRLLLYIRFRLGPALRSRLQTEDILQSVFKDAVADLRTFEPRGQDSLERFLHVCALNKIRKKVRTYSAAKRGKEVPLTDTILERAEEPGHRDARIGYRNAPLFDKIERGLTVLPEPMREVLLLRLFETRSNQEAADALGKTPDATSKLYRRALARLGVQLSGATG